jgi:hypothetical protein
LNPLVGVVVSPTWVGYPFPASSATNVDREIDIGLVRPRNASANFRRVDPAGILSHNAISVGASIATFLADDSAKTRTCSIVCISIRIAASVDDTSVHYAILAAQENADEWKGVLMGGDDL